MTRASSYTCPYCKAAPRRGRWRRSWRWKTERGFLNHKCYKDEVPVEPKRRFHRDRENGKSPSWLTGPSTSCPHCQAPIPYSGLRNPGLHFACPFCEEEVQWVRAKSRESKAMERICSLCGSPMVSREGKYGQFWGCSSYTKKNPCRGKALVISVPSVAWEMRLVAWEVGTGFDGADAGKVAQVEGWRERKEQQAAWRRKKWIA